MTEDDTAVEQAIIDVLRSDARAPIPLERRRRVASRLAGGAGIMGLATSVAGATHAAVASGAAVTSGSVLGAGVTLVGLTKALLVGMGLGAGAGLGLYATFRSSAPASSAVHAPPAALAVPPTTPLRVAPPAAPGPEPAASVPPPEAPPVTERPLPSTPGPRANPSPELPRDATPEKARSLAEQQALLDDARSALRRGDGSAALAALRSHIARFPETAFDEERQAVAIKALVLVGQLDAARQREAAFERRFPASLLRPSLRAAVGSTEVQGSVAGSAPSGQPRGSQ